MTEPPDLVNDEARTDDRIDRRHPSSPKWIDTHVHLVDFLQRPGQMPDLRDSLVRNGATRAVVFGLPVKKKWSTAEPVRPDYYLDDNAPCHYHSLTDATVLDVLPDLESDGVLEVAPLVCGFDPTDLLAIEHLDFVWSRSDRWAGVGEVMFRHDDLTNLTSGEVPSPDHVAMDAVLDFCAQNDAPISLHHDSSSVGMPDRHEYAGSLSNALDRHPSTSVVWCHAGVSRQVDPSGQLDLVRRMIERHRNLTVELSWVLLDRIADENGADEDWVRLVAREPDRFVVGSDTVARADTVDTRGAQIRTLLSALPGSAAERVAFRNAEALWFG
ncbi:amidohydrolase family protein [Rhodococcus sp. NPDC057529]|uniref:amidohydrolase family protein n=1 Tax=Rhodococcus sp. NPDC057529 TaxID=3346158 RepID=UPI003671779D